MCLRLLSTVPMVFGSALILLTSVLVVGSVYQSADVNTKIH